MERGDTVANSAGVQQRTKHREKEQKSKAIKKKIDGKAAYYMLGRMSMSICLFTRYTNLYTMHTNVALVMVMVMAMAIDMTYKNI